MSSRFVRRRKPGLGHVTLLEEPQAAFYAWIAGQGDSWRRRVGVGDLVLVCDVGGGTTDFSLIAVSEEGGELRLERVAVGEHILLGGDNMDLALARVLSGTARGAGAQGRHMAAARAVAPGAAREGERCSPIRSLGAHPVTLLGRGSKLIGGSIRTEVTADDVRTVLLDGFLPRVGERRDACAAAASGDPGARAAVRRRCGGDAAAREVSAAAGSGCRDRRQCGAAPVAWRVRHTCSSTAA